MEFLIGFTVGLIGSLPALHISLRKTRVYRKRWLDALQLLDAERLGTASLEEISGQKNQKQLSSGDPVGVSLRDIKRLPTWDRKDLEIKRAKAGLPPLDDLRGMASWDKKDVIEARLKYAHKQNEGS